LRKGHLPDQLIRDGFESGKLLNDPKETAWLEQISSGVESIPSSEDDFIAEMIPLIDSSKIDLKEYGL